MKYKTIHFISRSLSIMCIITAFLSLPFDFLSSMIMTSGQSYLTTILDTFHLSTISLIFVGLILWNVGYALFLVALAGGLINTIMFTLAIGLLANLSVSSLTSQHLDISIFILIFYIALALISHHLILSNRSLSRGQKDVTNQFSIEFDWRKYDEAFRKIRFTAILYCGILIFDLAVEGLSFYSFVITLMAGIILALVLTLAERSDMKADLRKRNLL